MGDRRQVRRIRAAGGLLAALFIPIALLVLLGRSIDSPPHPIGSMLPPLALRTLDGVSPSLVIPNSQKSVLILFTTECSNCQRQLDIMAQLFYRYQEHLQFIGVSLSDLAATQTFVSGKILPFKVYTPVTANPKDSIGIVFVPTLFFVDEHNILRDQLTGVQSPSRTEAAIRTLIFATPNRGAGESP